jgi:polysaccharide export outer membrane protein
LCPFLLLSEALLQQEPTMLEHSFNAVGGQLRLARVIVFAAVCGLPACASQPLPPPVLQEQFDGGPLAGADETMSLDAGYVLEPGDVVRISVWREPDLDDTVLVRPDGGISFPLVGDLVAEGKTIAAVTDEITQRLMAFIPNPVVTVSLQQNEGNQIFVTGRVNNPGVFVLTRPTDIMQALSMAGGLSPFADKNSIKVLRRQGGQQIALPFNYKQVQKGEALRQNIELQAGDTLVVP